MTNKELIETAKEAMKDLWELNQGKLLEHEQTAYNCLRLFCERLQEKDPVKSRFESDTFINNVCLSFMHDFGLMQEQEKERLVFECKEWMRAILNNFDHFKP